MNEKKAIVLGGTAPHAMLINKLKKRGYYVILVDYLKESPGKKVADKHICESTLDLDKVYDIAKRENVSLVISTCIDQANLTCCYVAEKLNLTKPYTYETALDVTDKSRMKGIMVDNHIPTAEYMVYHNLEEIDWKKVTFPSVVKPVDCNSSKGVHRVDNIDEAKKYAAEAIGLSRTKTGLIEKFNSGNEIQVDCFVTDEKVEVIMTRQKQKIIAENGMVLQSFGSIVPAPLSDALMKEAEDIANKIAKGFKLKNTPFFYQAIVSEDNHINVLEFALRIGGGLSYYLIKMVTGFDIVEAAIDSFLGNKVIVNKKQAKKVYSTNLLYMHPGVFHHIEGFEKLKKENIIKDFFVNKETGDVIDADIRSGNRVGSFIIEADDYNELYKKAAIAFDNIEVRSPEGEPLLNRETYIIKKED